MARILAGALIVPHRALAAPQDTPHRIFADLHLHAGLHAWSRESPIALALPPPLLALTESEFNRTGFDWHRCHDAGVDLICATHYNPFDELVSMPVDPDPNAAAHTHRMIDRLEREVHGRSSRYARITINRAEMKSVLSVRRPDPEYRIAVVHTIEGAHALGGDLRNVESFARRGVAMMSLTHFTYRGVATTGNGLPFFPDLNRTEPTHGLSPFGRELIDEMERTGMIVDVTHSSASSVEDVLAIARRPLIASHTAARTLADRPYSLHDDHIREITRRGGLIGVILFPYMLANYASIDLARERGSLDEVVRTIEHVTAVSGSHRRVAIGSDFLGWITGPKEMKRLSDIGRLRTALLDRFDGSEKIVADILANNAIRFLEENWGSP